MANYRLTSYNLSKAVSSGGTSCFKIEPLSTEQTPTGRLSKIKLSVIPSGENGSDNSYLVHASSSASSSFADIITAQAVPAGGGTVWLSVKRTIRDENPQSDRNDGPVYIWIRSSMPNSTVDAVLETWGRFLDLDPV